jgi:hypothetical protein
MGNTIIKTESRVRNILSFFIAAVAFLELFLFVHAIIGYESAVNNSKAIDQ